MIVRGKGKGVQVNRTPHLQIGIFTVIATVVLSLFIGGLPNASAFTENGYLKPAHIGSTATSTGEKCPDYSGSFPGGIDKRNLDAWHFVLPRSSLSFTSTAGLPNISVTFQTSVPGETVPWVAVIQDFNKHIYVYTPADLSAVLMGAKAQIGGLSSGSTEFMLSHTCAGQKTTVVCSKPLTLAAPVSTFVADPVTKTITDIVVLSSTTNAGDYTWSVTGGVTFNPSTGTISGTLSPSTSSITISGTGPSGCSFQQSYTLSPSNCTVSFVGAAQSEYGPFRVGNTIVETVLDSAIPNGSQGTTIQYLLDSSSFKWNDREQTLPPNTSFITVNGVVVKSTSTGISVSGAASIEGVLEFVASATLSPCTSANKTFKITFVDDSCKLNLRPTLPDKNWPRLLVGSSLSDTILPITNGNKVKRFRVTQIDANTERPPGLDFTIDPTAIALSGRLSSAGSYGFRVLVELTSDVQCTDFYKDYYVFVNSLPTSPSPTPTNSPTTPLGPISGPTPANSPSSTPTPSPTETPEDEPSASPKPTPTVTVTITASPVATTRPESISTPVPTPTQTTTIVEKVPTAAKSKSVVAINCGEVVTLDLKSLTADGSTFEITQLPTTGKILQPNPDTLIYIPDKEQCELGGNDTFSYALKDKSGNIKTVEKVVSPVIEGDVPKWIRTGYVPANSTRGAWTLTIATLILGLIAARRLRKKSL